MMNVAAKKGHEVVVVKLLLKKGAELESKDKKYGWTPLLWAAEKGHEAVAKLLLEKGAEPQSKDNDGRTPLSWAAEASKSARGWSRDSYEAVVKLLLEEGAEKSQQFDLAIMPSTISTDLGSEQLLAAEFSPSCIRVPLRQILCTSRTQSQCPP
jgi:ankyrin repeat protein